MSALHTVAVASAMGLLMSIPPGPAGVIILSQSLRGARTRAGRSVVAFLGADVLATGLVLLFSTRFTSLAALPWIRVAAGLFLIGFAANGWRTITGDRGLHDATAARVFRLTILNPMIWLGAVTMVTVAVARTDGGLVSRLLFLAGVDLGALGWYLTVMFAAARVPVGWRIGLERAVLLSIGAGGVWFVISSVLARA